MAVLELKKWLILGLVVFIIGCTNISYQEPNPVQEIVGNDSDSHGCKASAGYSWCEEQSKCLRSWEEACSRTYEVVDLSNIQTKKDEFSPMYIVSTKKSDYEYPLRYLPTALNYIKIEQGISELIKENIYLTKDPELVTKTQGDSTIASMEVGDVLAKSYKKEVHAALTRKLDNVIPVKTCEDSSETTTIIYLRLGNQNQIIKQGDCIIIEGVDGQGLIKSSERLAYYLLSKL